MGFQIKNLRITPSLQDDLKFRYPGLTIDQIADLGIVYRDFVDGTISYHKLLECFNSSGINAVDTLIWKGFLSSTKEEMQEFRKRADLGNYLSTDIFGFYYRNSEDGTSHLFLGDDIHIVELLAFRGDERAIREIEERNYPKKYKK